MSQNIIREMDFFLQAMLLGIMIAVFYDTIRIFRRVFCHGVFLVAIEDFIFWFVCCIKIFEMFVRENSGTLRMFAIMANAAGMLLYCKTVSRLYVAYVSRFLKFLKQLIGKAFRFLMKPFRFLYGWLKQMKNRLTKRLKLLIMILCKR